VEAEFSELPEVGVLGTSHVSASRKLGNNAAETSGNGSPNGVVKDPRAIIEAGPGVYFLDSGAPVDELVRLAKGRGFTVFRLDGHDISDKATFLREAAVSMHFPAYFGYNWDAFDECIHDLEWKPANGYVLLYDRFRSFAEDDPSQWETATDILRSAVDYWSRERISFYVLLRE
jgi:hypothetical protein